MKEVSPKAVQASNILGVYRTLESPYSIKHNFCLHCRHLASDRVMQRYLVLLSIDIPFGIRHCSVQVRMLHEVMSMPQFFPVGAKLGLASV